MNKEELLSMKFGEVKKIAYWDVTKVYNGWIFHTSNNYSQTSVFVSETLNCDTRTQIMN